MSQYSRQPTRSLAQVIETVGEFIAGLEEVHVSDLHTCGRYEQTGRRCVSPLTNGPLLSRIVMQQYVWARFYGRSRLCVVVDIAVTLVCYEYGRP